MTIALISGTSGLVGMQLLHQLLRNPAYSYVLSVGRRSLALKHEKLLQIDGDLSKLNAWAWEDKINAQSLGGAYQTLVMALQEKKVDVHAFCSLGTTIKQVGAKDKFYAVDHDLVIEFASWSKKLGATKFLYVSAMGANPHSSIFYNQVKGKTEEDLKALGFSYLGIFRPSLLLGARHEFRFSEQVATFFMMPLSWLKLGNNIRPIRDHVVAKSLVNVALSDSKSSVYCFLSGKMQELGT
ncbi:MAG: oxidoreductase [Bacteroidetes bacterium]|nr:oxidoreductase [Bacteroidota bacterium]